jgi:cob(I)alamin adenosyltransferase
VRQLRERIDLLEEQIRQLREDLVPVNNPFLHTFSRQHAALLLGIYSKRLATYAYLDAICSKTGHINRGEGDDYARRRVKVAIFKLKKKLRALGVEISTRRGLGYYLDDENKAKVEKLMEKKDDRST